LLGKTHLFLDRGSVFTADVRDLLRRAGVQPVRTPPKSPNLNAYAERFVRSVRQECLDHVIILGEQHLRHVIAEDVAFYNRERPHQGIGNVMIRPPPRPANDNGPVKCRQRLGGLLLLMKGTVLLICSTLFIQYHLVADALGLRGDAAAGAA